MIKRMLQPSKSMLSSNLCETWDLILNRIYNEAVGIFRFQQLLVGFLSIKLFFLNSLKSQSYVVSLKTKI